MINKYTHLINNIVSAIQKAGGKLILTNKETVEEMFAYIEGVPKFDDIPVIFTNLPTDKDLTSSGILKFLNTLYQNRLKVKKISDGFNFNYKILLGYTNSYVTKYSSPVYVHSQRILYLGSENSLASYISRTFTSSKTFNKHFTSTLSNNIASLNLFESFFTCDSFDLILNSILNKPNMFSDIWALIVKDIDFSTNKRITSRNISHTLELEFLLKAYEKIPKSSKYLAILLQEYFHSLKPTVEDGKFIFNLESIEIHRENITEIAMLLSQLNAHQELTKDFIHVSLEEVIKTNNSLTIFVDDTLPYNVKIFLSLIYQYCNSEQLFIFDLNINYDYSFLLPLNSIVKINSLNSELTMGVDNILIDKSFECDSIQLPTFLCSDFFESYLPDSSNTPMSILCKNNNISEYLDDDELLYIHRNRDNHTITINTLAKNRGK